MKHELPHLCECESCDRVMLLDEAECIGDRIFVPDDKEPDGVCPWCGWWVHQYDPSSAIYNVLLAKYAARLT